MKKVKSRSARKAGVIALGAVLALSLGVTGAVTGSLGAMRSAAAATNAYATRYTSDYSSKEEATRAGAALNEKIAGEGMVLLKNDGILPLKTGKGTNSTKITLLGYNSIQPKGGGGERGSDASGGIANLTSNILSNLKATGYKVNPTAEKTYKDWISAAAKAGETTDDALSDWKLYDTTKNATTGFASIRSSYADYSDAAIVTLSLSGGVPTFGMMEDGDLKEMLDDAKPEERSHSRSLDVAQLAVLEEANKHFDDVIVLVNSSVPFELGVLEKYKNVSAVLLVGEPGSNGFDALGKVLSGEINPSGRLTDLYAADFTADPSWNNFGKNQTYVDEAGNAVNPYYVEYEEGIYIGYRYYETVAAELGETGEEWYKDAVVYPFGYGLSYSNFNWEIIGSSHNNNTAITKDSKIKLDVKVTNAGAYAGKDVVELYYTAPYGTAATENTTVIEKSHVVLGDFEKTGIIEPGESETVTLELDASDMASYDYITDKTYVLDKGAYELKLMTNSHEVKKNGENDLKLTLNVGTKQLCKESAGGAEVTNRFDDINNEIEEGGSQAFDAAATRSNFKENKGTTEAPVYGAVTTLAAEGKKLTAAQLKEYAPTIDAAYDEGKPWFVAEDKKPTQADAATRPAKAEIMLSDLIGADINDARWETLLNQLTVEEMANLINNGGFNSGAIDYIGKPFTFDTDGPKGWTGNGTAGENFNVFATEPVVASTWNKELAYEMGKMIADQGIWGNSDTGESLKTYTGWYAPAMNTHRSPLDMRFTEYYSEDGYLAGMMAANASLGAASKGAYVYIKHFALHEDGGGVASYRGIIMNPTGTNGGLSIWLSEQALREIYLKPFQIAVEDGEAMGAMSSFSRFGRVWAGGSYALLTEVLRNEWGFKGQVVTDIVIYDHLIADQMIRAGGDLLLSASMGGMLTSTTVSTDEASLTATQLAAMRRATKAILYTTANSNTMQVPIGASVVLNGGKLTDATIKTAYTANVGTASLNTIYAYADTIEYGVSGLPEGLEMDVNGNITGTPTAEGTYNVVVTASAANYKSTSATFTITVNPAVTTDDKLDDVNDKLDEVGGKVDEVNGKADAIDGKTDTAIKDAAAARTVGIVGIVLGAVGIAAGIGALVFVFLKKKN